jgi:hypothetical protein
VCILLVLLKYVYHDAWFRKHIAQRTGGNVMKFPMSKSIGFWSQLGETKFEILTHFHNVNQVGVDAMLSTVGK